MQKHGKLNQETNSGLNPFNQEISLITLS